MNFIRRSESLPPKPQVEVVITKKEEPKIEMQTNAAARGKVLERRMLIRLELSELFLPHYDLFCTLLDANFGGYYWAPYSGLRSLEEQDKLYQQGRSKPGRIVTNAPAGSSAHNWGCATDWAEFFPGFSGQDIWNKANWRHFESVARQVPNIRWGGYFSIVDKPHIELKINTRWGDIGREYALNGKDKAIEMIKKGAIS